jgi:hypothetical protein
LAAACLLAPPVAAVVVLEGTTSATFEWSPATGPVVGYAVYVSFSGADEVRYSSVIGSNRETVEASYGGTVQMSVSSFDEEGREGPRSAASEVIQFLEPPPPTQDPPPPADDPPPPADDPPLGDAAAPLDFDGDGISDILLHNRRTARMRVWAMDGSVVVEEIELPELPPGAQVVGNGDYDGDGFADVLCLDPTSGQIEVWLIEGGALADRTTLGTAIGEDWTVAGSGDFDADGHADFVLRDPLHGFVEVWYVDGSQVLEIVEIADAPGPGWRLAGTEDFTGDGVADLLWHERSTGDTVLWSLASGEIEATPFGAIAPSVALHTVGDLDGDGRSDVLMKHDQGWDVALVGANGVGEPQSFVLGKQGLALRRTATGDFDGDGNMDIVMKHRKNKRRYLFLMQGTTAAAVEELPALRRGWVEAGALD